MTPSLAQAIERLQQMSPERQDAFARLILREILADEQWQRSAAQAAEWKRQQQLQAPPAAAQKPQAKPQPSQLQQRANQAVPLR